jgi:hypothetical protein
MKRRSGKGKGTKSGAWKKEQGPTARDTHLGKYYSRIQSVAKKTHIAS